MSKESRNDTEEPQNEPSCSHGEKQDPCCQDQPKTFNISEIELERLRAELSECKDKYLLALAESENARKRLQKERQELIQYALQNMVVDFLNPIDHMENALKFTQQTSEEVQHWAVGFEMILNQFKDVLTTNGVVSFESEGTQFDPHSHEAVEMIVTEDYPPGIVVSENLKGYKMGNRTIRPARVVVAKAPSKQSEASEESEGPDEINEKSKKNNV